MDKESDPQLYEISYLTNATDEQAVLESAARIGGAIEKEHGIITTQTQPTRKVLGYPVGGDKEGWWGWIKFMVRPESLAAIKEQIKNDTAITRFVFFRINKSEVSERPARRRRIVQAPAEQKADVAEIDKKLEEMLGT